MKKKEKTKNIIEYLYKLEFLSPFTPSGKTIYDSTSNKAFTFSKIIKPKSEIQKEPKKVTLYSIYLGMLDYDKVVEKIYETLNIKYNKNTFTSSKSMILGFKIKENGTYLSETFSICNCIYALNKILKEKNVNVELSEKEKNELITKLTTKSDINSFNYNVAIEYLENLINATKEIFPFLSDNITFEYKIIEEEIYVKDEEEIICSQAILTSFYLEDLKYIKEHINPKIIEFLSLKCENKIEIEKSINDIKEVLDPKNYPLGKWPSKFHPCLMQQIAINLSLHNPKPIFSVNGPPGSGKTTLVKEVIVDIIVRRAKQMLKFSTPDDAFTTVDFENPSNSYYSSFAKIDSTLSKYGILIASNNNNAVENISLELPLAEKLKSKNTLTNLFDIDINEEVYFTEIASVLSENTNWGLISAPLGKSENIKKFNNAIWFSKETKTIRDYIKEHTKNWKETKEKFQKKLNEVEKYQKFLQEVKEHVNEYESLNDKITKLKKELKISKKELETNLNKKKTIELEIQKLEKNNNDIEKLITDLKRIMPFYLKLLPFLFKNHQSILKLNELNSKYLSNLTNILNLKESINLTNDLITQKEEVVNKINNNINASIQKEKEYKELLNKYKTENKIVLLDNEYLKNITTNLKSQESCPWTNEEYDTLREELFYEALNLHKSFILESTCFKKNINLLVDALKGSLNESAKEECYKDLINTLFLFVPVISTSLASVHKFLSYIKEDEISYLIIDEAGQATPASVLGAVNRSKKTIVLGDPFQVEPVVPTPQEVYNILDYKNKIPHKFHDNTLSAQIIADNQNIYGALRGSEDEPVWIGCPLLLHRRCIEPMFSISNTIAYENKMFYCTNDGSKDKNLSIAKSMWIDIEGEELEQDNHYIKEQGEKTLELVKNALKTNNGKLPNMYIISPFKSVADTMRKELTKMLLENTTYTKRDITTYVNDSCGTIHTFQGKEVDEVIILLGCSSKSKKAAEWAGSKPNILNVAVTRAKYRLIIIGSANLWKKIPYFSDCYKILNNTKKDN